MSFCVYTVADHAVEMELSVLLGSLEVLPVGTSFTILDLGLSQRFLSRFSKWKSGRKVSIDIIQVNPEIFSECYPSRSEASVNWAKLAGPRLLQGKSDKLLYVDADCVFVADPTDALPVDLEHFPFGDCQSRRDGTSKPRRLIATEGGLHLALGGRKEFYPFNSGVLWINRRSWVERNVEKAAMERSRATSSPHGDQYMLNALFGHDYRIMASVLNYYPDYFRDRSTSSEMKSRVRILHCAGIRPWRRIKRVNDICRYAFPFTWFPGFFLLQCAWRGPDRRRVLAAQFRHVRAACYHGTLHRIRRWRH